MKSLLIAVNSFKDSSSSTYITRSYEQLLEKEYNVKAVPLTDGGDGFLEVCKDAFNLEVIEFQIKNSFNNEDLKVNIGYDGKRIMYLESADVIGLKLLPKNYRNAAVLNSQNLGELLIKIIDKIIIENITVDKLVIGVGGTAVSDFGAGMMRRLGINYLIKGKLVNELQPINFPQIDDMDVIYENLPFEIEVIADVDNPLLGNSGAVRTFGKQKGLDKFQMDVVEKGFENLVNLFEQNGLKINKKKLSGAGGGIAAAFQIFYNADVIPAEEFILTKLKIKKYIDKVNYVITGEGKFDNQSINNKVPGIIINNFKNAKKIFLCCGQIEKGVEAFLPKNVEIIEFSSFYESEEESIKNMDLSIKKSADIIINRKK